MDSIKNEALNLINNIRSTNNNIINKTQQLNIGIVGDFIIDKYDFVTATRKNLEHSGLILDSIDSSYFYGGAANVSNIIGNFCVSSGLNNQKTIYFGGCGRQDPSYLTSINMHNPETFSIVFEADNNYNRVIPVKTRVIENSRVEYLYRVDKEPTRKEFPRFDKEIDKKLLTLLDIFNINVICFSDYKKGFLNPDIVKSIMSLDKIKRIYCNIRPDQIKPYINPDNNVHLLSFNQHEFIRTYEILFKEQLTVITVDDINRFKSETNVQNLIITFGSGGFMFSNGEGNKTIKPLKGLNVSSKNIIGAGDMIISSYIFFDTYNYLFFNKGFNIDVILYLVNICSFLKVYTGLYTVDLGLVEQYLNNNILVL